MSWRCANTQCQLLLTAMDLSLQLALHKLGKPRLSPDLPVLEVISFCTNSKCFLFNVCHRAVCFDTCFPVPLKLSGNGSICHLRTWKSLGFFLYFAVQSGNLQQVIYFFCHFLERTEQSPPSRGYSHSCHSAIFSFKMKKITGSKCQAEVKELFCSPSSEELVCNVTNPNIQNLSHSN